jgi:hypothetical protein
MISTTQKTNFLSLAGALVVVLGYFDIKIEINELAELMGAVAMILGTLLNYLHRYQKGDVTFLGIRNTTQTVDAEVTELG